MAGQCRSGTPAPATPGPQFPPKNLHGHAVDCRLQTADCRRPLLFASARTLPWSQPAIAFNVDMRVHGNVHGVDVRKWHYITSQNQIRFSSHRVQQSSSRSARPQLSRPAHLQMARWMTRSCDSYSYSLCHWAMNSLRWANCGCHCEHQAWCCVWDMSHGFCLRVCRHHCDLPIAITAS